MLALLLLIAGQCFYVFSVAWCVLRVRILYTTRTTQHCVYLITWLMAPVV